MEEVSKVTTQRETRVEQIMDEVLEHKLREYESRLAWIETEVGITSKQLNDIRTSSETLKSDSQNLHGETLKRFVEFADKLEEISKEIKNIENALQDEGKTIETIREHEAEAVSNVRKWEKKIIINLKKKLNSRKTLDAVVKRLTSGKHKSKIETAVRNASNSTKARTALVNAVLNDRKLRAKLVNDVLAGTRGKLKRQKTTTTMANVAAKKVMKTIKPKVRKAAKSAAKKAVATEAHKV